MIASYDNEKIGYAPFGETMVNIQLIKNEIGKIDDPDQHCDIIEEIARHSRDSWEYPEQALEELLYSLRKVFPEFDINLTPPIKDDAIVKRPKRRINQ